MRVASRPPLLPPKATAAPLFFVGATLGPLVDSLHNQCLLAYDFAPITVGAPSAALQPLFCSSWAVPPLLGVAYLVLGYILPRVIELILHSDSGDTTTTASSGRNECIDALRNRAIFAVGSTAAIIKLSEFLETHDAIAMGSTSFTLTAEANVAILMVADLLQWATLDRTTVALLAATITAFGGPLSELPFVSNGLWHYLPQSADYLPLSGDFFRSEFISGVASKILGDEYSSLALSSITGPCYFAVTMDAIALGRYFYQSSNGGDKS